MPPASGRSSPQPTPRPRALHRPPRLVLTSQTARPRGARGARRPSPAKPRLPLTSGLAESRGHRVPAASPRVPRGDRHSPQRPAALPLGRAALRAHPVPCGRAGRRPRMRRCPPDRPRALLPGELHFPDAFAAGPPSDAGWGRTIPSRPRPTATRLVEHLLVLLRLCPHRAPALTTPLTSTRFYGAPPGGLLKRRKHLLET